MRLKFIVIFMFIATSIFSQTTKKINITGFGELAAVQNGDSYAIKIADYGTFDFKGTISPINLETEVTIEQLKKFPGYKVMSNLGLEEIVLKVSNEGLEVEAKANTKKNLGKLCEFLKIKSPYIEVEAKIGKDSELSGTLAFSDQPIKLLSVDKLGTKISFSSVRLEAALEPGSVEIGVKTEFKMTPTREDPELTVVYEFKYDLLTQDITGAGSLMGSWVDPFGMDKYVAKNSVIFENGAVELGVNVATLTPSNIGFALKQGKLFDLDFGIFMSVAPTDNKFAFYAENRTKLTLNQVSQILRKNFNLKVPDIFPKDYYLDSTKVKFALGEASVGEVELERGFALMGAGRFKELDGFIDFSFDLENEFHFEMNFEGDYSKFIWNEAKKIKNKQVKELIKQALKEIKVQRMHIDLNAQKSNLALKGKAICEFKFQNKLEKVSFEASLDAKEIAKNLIEEIKKTATSKLAKEISEKSVKIVKDASSEAKKLMNNLSSAKNHLKHFNGKCNKECIPNRAYELSRHVNYGAFDAVRKFYFEMIPVIGDIKGSNPDETRKIRSKLIEKQWQQIETAIEDDWKSVYNDKDYENYLITNKNESKKIYQDKVAEYRKKERDYRKKIWERMITRSTNGNEKVGIQETEIPEGIYYIQSAMEYKKSKKGYLEFPGKNPGWKKKGNRMDIWTKDNNPNKLFYFERNFYLSYYIICSGKKGNRDYAIDCKGRKRNKRTPLHSWKKHKGASQQFKLKHTGDGKFLIVPKMNGKMCIALVDNKHANNGNKVHLWTYSKDKPAKSKLWYLINAKTGKKFVPK